MRTLLLSLSLSGALLCVVPAAGCSSPRPGISNSFGTYSTVMDAAPDTVTEAAVEVVDDLKLTLESSAASAVDGKVVALTAQDTRVSIKVELAGANVSKVSVRVGGVGGDQGLSLDIIDRIQAKL